VTVAVRISADGQEYTRALSLGVTSQFAFTCWLKPSVDRNSFSTPVNFDNNNSANSIRGIQTGMDGVTLEPYHFNGPFTGTKATLVVGTWYYFAVNFNGTAANWRYRASTAASFTAASFTGASDSSITMTTLRLGDSAWGAEWFNGCLAAVKIWHGINLTDAEMDNECWRYVPQRTNGLVAWYPLVTPETVDYSGNAATLSGGTGATREDGPPVGWGARRISRPIAAAAPAVLEFSGWGVPI
jgi:hypothetical protein